MTPSGKSCEWIGSSGRQCGDKGWIEYCGFCSHCWLKLTEDQREILQRDRHRASPTIEKHDHHHSHYHPPQSRIVSSIIALVCGGLGALAMIYVARYLGL